MIEIEMSANVIQTHVWYGNVCFFVSTINRESSATCGGTYAETLVWEWDEEAMIRGKLLGQAEGSVGSIYAHQAMVKRLHETGNPEAAQ